MSSTIAADDHPQAARRLRLTTSECSRLGLRQTPFASSLAPDPQRLGYWNVYNWEELLMQTVEAIIKAFTNFFYRDVMFALGGSKNRGLRGQVFVLCIKSETLSIIYSGVTLKYTIYKFNVS